MGAKEQKQAALFIEAAVPTFSVFVLGMRGSGKTVFLAAMYSALFVNDAKRGYYISCNDAEKQSILLNRFNFLRDRGEWPYGDQISTEYLFDLHYVPQHSGQQSVVTRFSYVDYPGAWIIGQGERTFEVSEKAAASDSVLFLLDGQKIKDYIDGKVYNEHILHDVLQLTPYVQQCATARKPIHFIVTKYDLLDPLKYPFSKIQSLLFSVDPFREVLKQIAKTVQVRMIPVSAIGPDFASFDPKSGRMIKRINSVFKPMNLDVSISLTIYDQLKMLSKGLDPTVAKEIARGKRRKELLDTIVAFMDAASRWSPIAYFVATSTTEGLIIIQVMQNLRRFAGAKRDQIDAEIARIMSTAKDQKGAFLAIVAVQALLMQRFEERLPESNVSARLAKV